MAAAIWGQGFVATKWVLQDYGPLWGNALRYLVAGAASLISLLLLKSWRRPKAYWLSGLWASILLMAGMLFQIYGLAYTTVSKSGFLTSFYAFFIPLIGVIFKKQRYPIGLWGLLLLALVGVALLCDLKFEGFNIGDGLTLLCALCFALHIDYLGKIAPQMTNPFEFNAIQCFLIALMSLALALLFLPIPDLAIFGQWHEWYRWGSVVMGVWFLGIFSSFIAFAIQVYGQRKLPAAIAGMIFLLESPFAAVFGYWQLGEKLSTLNIVGCLLVLFAVALIPFFWRDPHSIKN
jgi:drug/metabolite transporter (DMT)-like permease